MFQTTNQVALPVFWDPHFRTLIYVIVELELCLSKRGVTHLNLVPPETWNYIGIQKMQCATILELYWNYIGTISDPPMLQAMQKRATCLELAARVARVIARPPRCPAALRKVLGDGAWYCWGSPSGAKCVAFGS